MKPTRKLAKKLIRASEILEEIDTIKEQQEEMADLLAKLAHRIEILEVKRDSDLEVMDAKTKAVAMEAYAGTLRAAHDLQRGILERTEQVEREVGILSTGEVTLLDDDKSDC